MNTHSKNQIERIGEIAGAVTAYGIFTTLLFFVLSFLGRLPATFSYFHMTVTTAGIVLLGAILKKLLR